MQALLWNISKNLPYTLFLFDVVNLRPRQHCTKHGINFSTTSAGTPNVWGIPVVLLHSKPCRMVPGNPLLSFRRINNVWKSPGHITQPLDCLACVKFYSLSVLALFVGIPVFWTAVYGNKAVTDGVATHRCIQRLEFLFMNATSWDGLLILSLA